MSSLYLWFSEDFEKRYKEYRSKVNDGKTPEPFLLERLFDERENIANISDEAEYQNEIDKWEPLKIIVDAIYKQLSPFENKPQSVKIDISKLDISENMVRSVLMMLVYEHVCRWRIEKGTAVISTVPVTEYLRGEGIVVQDYKKFKDFRNSINDFYIFIERQKEVKFPKVRPPEISANFSSNLKYQKEALNKALDEGLKEEALTEKILKKVDEKIQKGKKPSFPELYLNTVGDLWREPKTKYCYPMGEKSDRHQILRYLATNKGYQQTSAMSVVLGDKSEQSIRTEIGKIRNNIKKFLKIDGKQIIEEGRKGSGYKIDLKYKIKIIP